TALIKIGKDRTQAGDLVDSPGKDADYHALSRKWLAGQAKDIFLGDDHELVSGRVVKIANLVKAGLGSGLFEFGQIAQLLFLAQHYEASAVGDERLQDIMAIRDQLANQVIGTEECLVTYLLRADDGELAGIGEFGIIRINLKSCRRLY